VYCDSALNVVTTAANAWYPLQVNTKLDSIGIKHALRNLAIPRGDWYYDDTKFRVFRWYGYEGNADSADKWVEYSDKTDWIFTFDIGKLIWIKTRKATTINLGSSITPSLRHPSAITLPPQSITDFSLPLGFDVLIGDVFASTDADTINNRGMPADSLQVYSFKSDPTGHYRAEALYLGHFAKMLYHLADPLDTLSKNSSGYCIFNPYNAPVTFSVPPTPVSMSTLQTPLVKKTGSSQNWAVAVKGHTGEGMLLSTVYCGHCEGSPKRTYYPAMPMMDGVGIRICDDEKRQFGHVVSQGSLAKEGGETFSLSFPNQSGVGRRITYWVEGIEALPKTLKVMTVDPATSVFEDARMPRTLDAKDGETVYRRLVIGTDAYVAKVKIGLRVFQLGLVGTCPNPFTRYLKIRYSLPESNLAVRFSIIDMKGRTVWKTSVTGSALLSGARELVWDGKSNGNRLVAAGMYMLKMTAIDERGKLAGEFEKKITYIP
jgi:hypothetical protein